MVGHAKKSLRKAIALLICLVLMSSFFAPVFAWYIGSLSTIVEVESGIIGSYFEQGVGTEDMPYVIAKPIQFYYFAWLQDLGYFDGENPASTTSDKKYYFTLSADIDMSENAAFAKLPPIGTLDHPFVGVFNGQYHFAPTDENGDPVADPLDPNNTLEGTYHVIKNLTISNDALPNIPTGGGEGQQFIGLFGVIGSMSNHAVQGTVKNFGLQGITLETEDPDDDQTIIGVVAGYCNGILEGIGVSNCSIKVKNGLGPTQVTTYQVDEETGTTSSTVTPSTLSFSLVGFTDQTYQAYNISPVSGEGGNEFGGSLAMDTIYTKITSAKNDNDSERWSYSRVKTVNIDEHGARTESFSSEATVDLNGDAVSKFYYLREYESTDENGNVYESYSAVERYSSSNKLVLADGNGNFAVATTSGITNTTNEDEATVWTMGTTIESTSGSSTLYTTLGNTRYYLYKGNNSTTLTTSTSSRTWNIAVSGNDYTDFKIYYNSYYVTYDNGWKLSTNSSTTIKALRKQGGDEVTQFTYLNGALTEQRYQKVITTTHTEYDAYLIQDEEGNYLVGTPGGGVSNTRTLANATAWRFSNGASGGTFSLQDDNEVTYYLYNNSGTLQVSSSNSTNWTVSNGLITNGGYYLTYLDGAWKLFEETTYYLIDDGAGTYLNYANSAVASGSRPTTRWHVSSGKIYTYDGTTKTYIYNNSGTLAITTNSGTATAWTIDDSAHTIKSGDYYLMYLDGAWKLFAETTYYSISDGNGNYLNYTNSSIAGGNSSTTRWHIASNKIYTYNGTTKTYIYNNNGTLAITTSSSTATAWTIDNNAHTIKSGDYYLMYLDGAWKILAETTYYAIDDGQGNYLNLSNGSLVAGNSSTTRWHFSNGASGGLLYTYVDGTKTYISRTNRTLSTTTASGSAASWTLNNSNHTISNNGYYLSYNDGAWSATQETEYYYIHNGNNTYLNYSNGDFAAGTSLNATRWYVSGGKIYTYVGDTATYLLNNSGVLSTTTTAGSASVWTIDGSSHSITNNNYYLSYNDSAWGLTKEAGYYFINDSHGHYLNLTGGSIDVGTSGNATRWYFVDGKIYAYNGTTATYLVNNGGALSTTTTVGSASTWTMANSNIKTGNYYLIYENGWMITAETQFYLISDGGSNYFNYAGGEYGTGTAQTATNWHISNGKIYTYVNGTATYVVNNSGTLSTTTTVGSATTWTIGADSITNGDYYLVYQNGWLLTDETGYYLISDGNGHYLNLTSEGYEVGTSGTAMGWHFSNGNSGGKIYTYVGGERTYILNNNGTLSTTTTVGSATTWTVSSNQISSNGYYIIYSNGWLLSNVSSYYTLSDNSGHYLNLTGEGLGVGTSSNATAWQMTSTTSGKIYTYINGTATYIYNNNGTLSTTTNSNTATTWTIDHTNNNIYNNGYYLTYNGSVWGITNNVSYFTINDNNNHYLNLSVSNNTALTAIGTSSNATSWKFSNKSSGGYISTNIGGTEYYLNYVDGNMVPQTTQSTSWTISGNTIYFNRSNDAKYYFFCDGSCWTLVRDGLNSYYLVSSGSNYFSCSTSGLENETVRSYARKWEFTSSSNYYSNRFYISTKINGTDYWLRGYRSGRYPNYTYYIEATTTQNDRTAIRTDNNKTYLNAYASANRYIYYSNGWTTSDSSKTLTVSNITSSTRNAVKTASSVQPDLVAQYAAGTYNRTNSIATNNYDLSIDIDNNDYNLIDNAPYTAYSLTANAPSTSYNIVANATSSSYNIVASTSSSSYNVVASRTTLSYDNTNEIEETTTVWKNTVTTRELADFTSKDTYIALANNGDGSVSLKNTGYIVGGSSYVDHSTYSGDIRVSYYPMSNLNTALNGDTYSDTKLEVLTQTYLSNGLVRIYDDHNKNNNSVSRNISSYTKNANTTNVTALGLDKYDEARDQLGETLTGQSNVYGLHFMDAQISVNKLATIGKAVINGSTYTNYSVPRDCIDFNLSTRGSINFFAGSYFPSNDSFFSLHRIVRSDGEIVAIKEISKIYGDPNDTSKNYIYWYSGEAEPSRPTGYTLMFDTDWIKSPTMVDKAMYYYEIPVNAGEYALGSVAGGLGAYLIYLDIGASAQALSDGTTLETAIKGIDFVTSSSLASASIATTLSAITQSTPAAAVIILKNRFQGQISFTIQEVTVEGAQVLRITYVLTEASAKDYVLWTKSLSSVEVVDGTAY